MFDFHKSCSIPYGAKGFDLVKEILTYYYNKFSAIDVQSRVLTVLYCEGVFTISSTVR